MQSPTLTKTCIQSAQEAQTVIYAVYLGLLNRISKRLTVAERSQLQPGDVYVSERTDCSSGQRLLRFTDGRKWQESQSRHDFLFYDERYVPAHGWPIEPPPTWQPLVKQTYSTRIEGNSTEWHLTAYFTWTLKPSLHGIRDWAVLANIEVPPDLFTPCRARERARRTGGQRQQLPIHHRSHSQPGLSGRPPSEPTANNPSAFLGPSLLQNVSYNRLSEADLRGLVSIDSPSNMSSTSNASTQSPLQAVLPHGGGGNIGRSNENDRLPARHRSRHLIPLHDLEVHRQEYRSRRRSVTDDMYLRVLDRRAFTPQRYQA